MRRSNDELDKMRKAGKVVAEMHEATRAAIRPGITTMDLNKVAAEVIERRGATWTAALKTSGAIASPVIAIAGPGAHFLAGNCRTRGEAKMASLPRQTFSV